MNRWPFVCGHSIPGLWWFRIWGYGLAWKDIRAHPLLFSERVLGYGWRCGRWHFTWLAR